MPAIAIRKASGQTIDSSSSSSDSLWLESRSVCRMNAAFKAAG
jgi:hypothetical protein